jgi:GntR family transcriptional repressor for pyruvate dehydrogenase complex
VSRITRRGLSTAVVEGDTMPTASSTPRPAPVVTVGSAPMQRETLSEQVSRRLMEWMADEGLQPGDRLPTELQLAASFGVSRPVVREALRALAALSILEISTGKPARVRPFSPDLVSVFLHWGMSLRAISSVDVHEFRKGVESESAALAATRLTPEAADELREIVAQMRTHADDFDKFGELDLQLHMAISAASGNALLQFVMASLRQPIANLIESGLHRMQVRGDSPKVMVDDHAAVVEAICAGDPDTARAAAAQASGRALDGVRKPTDT